MVALGEIKQNPRGSQVIKMSLIRFLDSKYRKFAFKETVKFRV